MPISRTSFEFYQWLLMNEQFRISGDTLEVSNWLVIFAIFTSSRNKIAAFLVSLYEMLMQRRLLSCIKLLRWWFSSSSTWRNSLKKGRRKTVSVRNSYIDRQLNVTGDFASFSIPIPSWFLAKQRKTKESVFSLSNFRI